MRTRSLGGIWKGLKPEPEITYTAELEEEVRQLFVLVVQRWYALQTRIQQHCGADHDWNVVVGQFAAVVARLFGNKLYLDYDHVDVRFTILMRLAAGLGGVQDTWDLAKLFIEKTALDMLWEKFFKVVCPGERESLFIVLVCLGEIYHQSLTVEVLEEEYSDFQWLVQQTCTVLDKMKVCGGLQNGICDALDAGKGPLDVSVEPDKNFVGRVFTFDSMWDALDPCHEVLIELLRLIIPRLPSNGSTLESMIHQLDFRGRRRKIKFRPDGVFIDQQQMPWLIAELLARYLCIYRKVEVDIAEEIDLSDDIQKLLGERLWVRKDGVPFSLPKTREPMDCDVYDNYMDWIGKRVFIGEFESCSILSYDTPKLSMVRDVDKTNLAPTPPGILGENDYDHGEEVEDNNVDVLQHVKSVKKSSLLFGGRVGVDLNDDDLSLIQVHEQAMSR